MCRRSWYTTNCLYLLIYADDGAMNVDKQGGEENKERGEQADGCARRIGESCKTA